MVTLSQQVDLCMRLCRRCVTGSPCAVTNSTQEGINSSAPVLRQVSQIWDVLKVHAAAISRSWQWTASLVQARTLSLSSSGATQSVIPPPPPPPCDEQHVCASQARTNLVAGEQLATSRLGNLEDDVKMADTLECPGTIPPACPSGVGIAAVGRALDVDADMTGDAVTGGEDAAVVGEVAVQPMVVLSDSDECS
eukprot:4840073-Amphidinium_carterae.2